MIGILFRFLGSVIRRIQKRRIWIRVLRRQRISGYSLWILCTNSLLPYLCEKNRAVSVHMAVGLTWNAYIFPYVQSFVKIYFSIQKYDLNIIIRHYNKNFLSQLRNYNRDCRNLIFILRKFLKDSARKYVRKIN